MQIEFQSGNLGVYVSMIDAQIGPTTHLAFAQKQYEEGRIVGNRVWGGGGMLTLTRDSHLRQPNFNIAARRSNFKLVRVGPVRFVLVAVGHDSFL